MEESSRGFEYDLRASSTLVAGVLLIAGLLLVLASGSLSDMSDRLTVAIIAILLYGLSAVTWLLGSWRPGISRWFVVSALVVVIHLASHKLGVPGLLNLMVIPPVLAAALMDLRAAALIALGETALLLVPGNPAVNGDRVVVRTALGAAWVVVGVVSTIQRPIHQLSRDLWDYFERVRSLLEEARDQRVALKQALEDLAQVNRQLGLANERLAALRLIAEEAQKTKAAFVAKVSHELRTPLNMIIALVDLLVETPDVYGEKLPSALLEDLGIIHRNCEHLSGMVNDVLALSAAEVGRLTLHREQVSLPEIVDEALAVVCPLLEKKGLSLHVEVEDGLPEVHCDRTRIRQVVLNLVSNAARFTERGGIRIQVRQEDQRVAVSVADTGPGIQPDEAERVFEPFWQATSQPWRERSGSGLGLSISKQLVELHGGRIWLSSEPGVGSTFSFSLPTSEPTPHIARPGHWINPEWLWARHPTGRDIPVPPYRPRVVLADLSGDLYPAFSPYFDDVEFVDARDLAGAEQEVRRCPAHALVFNAGSPGDLWSLVDQAKRVIPDTPIIGCAVPSRMEHAFRAGATGYLLKPVTRADLEKSVRALGQRVRRILVVDDDPDVLRLLTRLLRAIDSALEIRGVSSGEQALDELRSRAPDLMLLDIVMRGMDGWEVLALKERDARIRDIPVVLISAQDPEEQPLVSPALVATMGRGLTLTELLRCSLGLSALLLEPDRAHDPGLG